MIGPGCLPRPRALRKRTLAYTRVPRARSRKAKELARASGAVNHEIVLFDHGPAEFPVARVMPRDTGGRALVMLGDLQMWLAARWSWLRPRTIPVIVAVFGMMFVLMSADYLSHPHVQPLHAAVHVHVVPR